jgi:hypothetical protein
MYITPESGAPDCSTGTLYTYNPKNHAEFVSASGVLLSYIPRFIRVPIAA